MTNWQASKPLRGHLYGRGVLPVMALVAAMALSTASTPAQALPAYAERTGLPCGQCHFNPEGGGPRTAFGKAFAANGHRLSRRQRNTPRYRDDYGHGMMGGYGHGMMDGGGRD